jgi:hypothetical protein
MTSIIDIPMFGLEIHVSIAKTSLKAVKQNKHLKHVKSYYEDWSNTDGGFVYDPKRQVYGIILAEDATTGTIAHESFHAAMYLLQRFGVVISAESEEVFAYMIGFLTDEVLKVKNEYHKKMTKELETQLSQNEKLIQMNLELTRNERELECSAKRVLNFYESFRLKSLHLMSDDEIKESWDSLRELSKLVKGE